MSLLSLPSQQSQNPLAVLESLLRVMALERKTLGHGNTITPRQIGALLNITDMRVITQATHRAEAYIGTAKRAEIKAKLGVDVKRSGRYFEFVVQLSKGDVRRVLV